jgi:hypothetical protein
MTRWPGQSLRKLQAITTKPLPGISIVHYGTGPLLPAEWKAGEPLLYRDRDHPSAKDSQGRGKSLGKEVASTRVVRQESPVLIPWALPVQKRASPRRAPQQLKTKNAPKFGWSAFLRPSAVLPPGIVDDKYEAFDFLGGDSWTVYRFLTQHHPELEGDSALSALQQGKVNQELTAAENRVDSLS